jgi:hypothetical protein
MYQIALFASHNGFGHLRRMIALGYGLVEIGIQPHIFISASASLAQIQILKECTLPFQVRHFDEVDGGEVDGPFTSQEERNMSHSFLSSEEISKYPGVVSDTLVWPSSHNSNSLFIGNFTWEQYRKCGTPNCRQYSLNELKNYKAILGIDLFSWASIKTSQNYNGIPPIDYWGLRNRKVTYLDQIGIAFNGTELGLNLPKPWRDLAIIIRGIPEFVELHDSIPKVIITRAGLGNVMETIAIGSRLVLTGEDSGKDTQYNRQALIDKGFAVSETQLLEELERLSEFSRMETPRMYSRIEFAQQVKRLVFEA